MGWENYLGPNHSGEAPTDFEIHRAQMRHYDDYMAQYDTAGGSLSSGYTGDTTGRGGVHLLLAGPDVVRKVSSGGPLSPAVYKGSSDLVAPRRTGGRLTFRESELIDLDDVDGSFDNMELTQVMHPETTSGRFFGQMMYSSPFFSDIETWAEARLGDIGGALLSPFVLAADIIYSTDLAADHASALVDAQRAATWRENHEALTQQWQDFNTQFPFVPEAFR